MVDDSPPCDPPSNDPLHKRTNVSKKKGLQFIHLNVHYLYPKFDEVCHLIDKYKQPDIVGLCETFLNTSFSDNEFQLKGYTMFRKDRNSLGGGVLLYINDTFSCIRRPDLEHENCESIWIDVKVPNQKTFTVGYIYRPPSADNKWFCDFECSLEKAFLENNELILFGDFNINYVDGLSDKNTWNCMTNCYNLVQLVTDYTRVTQTSATIIDHIYTNSKQHIHEINIAKETLSDHYLVRFTRKTKNKQSFSTHTTISFRSFKHMNEEEFLSDLSRLPLTAVQSFDNPDNALEYFTQLFTEVLNKHAPIKQKRVKHSHQPDWFTSEIANAIKCRNKFKQDKNSQSFKHWRKKVKNLCYKNKQQYYTNSITKNSNPKTLWNNLKTLSGKSPVHNNIHVHDNENNPIINKQEAAEFFNNHFSNVFKTSKSQVKLDTVHKSAITTFTSSKLKPDTMYEIPPISEDFILKQLKNLNTTKSTGLDEIGPRILKLSSEIIAKPLSHIFNLSIRKGWFPNNLKHAKIIPIHKKGSTHDVNNYRPISILPTLSKILERHIASNLARFLEENNLLHVNQSGFRKNHSCETALVALMDEWLSAIDDHHVIGTVLLDLSKAFDMVNHNLLLEKLQLYHCSPLALQWFTSYLSNRHQTVSLSGNLSTPQLITAGVPQGSILGPLLFILYINDLPLHITGSETNMFADDTTIYTYSKNKHTIQTKLQESLDTVSQWCNLNSMVLNSTKTKAMLLSASNKHQVNNLSLTLQNNCLHVSQQEKLLGITFDNNLSFKTHIEQTLKKCNSLLFLLLRIKCFLDLKTRKLFFNSYILPHLDYCITVWGYSANHHLDKLLKFQKRAARIIMDKEFDYPSATLFQELKWMTVYERLQYKTATLVFKSLTNMSPLYLSSKFHTVLYQNRQLRSSTNNLLYVPKPNLEIFRKSISYAGPKLWNSLPLEIRNAKSILSFKSLYIKFRFPSWADAESLQ